MENAMGTIFGRTRGGVNERVSYRTKQLISIAAGAVVMFGVACALHFVWDWTGNFLPTAIFAAVNESVWEHVKILSWSFLLWSVAEYYILRPDWKRFVTARTVGLVTVMLLTICFFYVYSGVLGRSVVWVDISSAAVWLLVGELVSIRALNSPYESEYFYFICVALLTLILVMLLCFTVSAPHIGLFRDPITGLYGLETRF